MDERARGTTHDARDTGDGTGGATADAARLSAGEKTLVVLQAAMQAPRFSDVVESTGLPKATVHRIVGELADRGFLVVTPAGEYLPGPAFLGLAGRALERVDISGLARPAVERLGSATGCTVHVAVRTGDEILYLTKRDSDKPYRMPSRVGSSAPLHSTAIGKALLATLDPDGVARLAQRTGLPQQTPRTITDVAALHAELDAVRARGFAVEREENVPGITCLGAAVRDHAGHALYGVSVSTLSIEHTPAQVEAMAGDVLDAAAAISHALGHRRP